LWDLDGTIADTRIYHFQAWKKIFVELHVPFNRKLQIATFGMNSSGILSTHLGYTPENGLLKDLTDRKEYIFRQLVLQRKVA
jgi:beta-phosphoglucomutase-like phosphatase (HAD superfamily)